MPDMVVETHESAPQGWDEFVEQHPHSKIYHLPTWNQIITKTFGHPVRYITVKRDGVIVGVLPLTEIKSRLFGRFCAVSQPFINYGGALLQSNEDMPVLAQYLTEMRQQRNYDFIELRNELPCETSLPGKSHKVTFFLDLPEDEEALMKSFKAKLRSQIRRPTKDEMTGKTGGLELLDDFYNVFALNMRDLGTPVLPKDFFANILKAFPEQAFIGVVHSKEGVACAASFLIKFRDVMEIPWASSLREYNRSSPNMLLYWESMKLSINLKCKVFDFGRCSRNVGTYKFKKQWGSREHDLHWYYVLPNGEELPDISPANAKYDLAIKMWQKMPLGLTKMIGPSIIKNIP